LSGSSGDRISTAALWNLGGGNYRAACRGRSRPEFLAKIGIVVEEADETVFWLEMLTEAGLVRAELLGDTISETNQLVAIFCASQLTVKRGFSIDNRQS